MLLLLVALTFALQLLSALRKCTPLKLFGRVGRLAGHAMQAVPVYDLDEVTVSHDGSASSTMSDFSAVSSAELLGRSRPKPVGVPKPRPGSSRADKVQGGREPGDEPHGDRFPEGVRRVGDGYQAFVKRFDQATGKLCVVYLGTHQTAEEAALVRARNKRKHKEKESQERRD